MSHLNNIVTAGYQLELKRLIELTTSVGFPELISTVASDGLLEMQKMHAFSGCLRSGDGSNAYSMDAGNADRNESKLYAYINLAAACSLFAGWTAPPGQLDARHAERYAALTHPNPENGKAKSIDKIALDLNGCDAVRVCLTLKLLGLLHYDSHKYRQLALGASTGHRDIDYMHRQPLVTETTALWKVSGMRRKLHSLSFDVRKAYAQDLVLIDLDPAIGFRYAQLNKESNDRVWAINNFIDKGLGELETGIKSGKSTPRDLVVLFRVEPAMIPDVEQFLALVSRVIDQEAKLVLTIGAGDDDKAYLKRKILVSELADILTSKGMRVERLRWCKGETLSEERFNPAFGIGNFSSYEVLYSELVRKKF